MNINIHIHISSSSLVLWVTLWFGGRSEDASEDKNVPLNVLLLLHLPPLPLLLCKQHLGIEDVFQPNSTDEFLELFIISVLRLWKKRGSKGKERGAEGRK